MSRTVSPSGAKPYGLARVCRVWRAARSTVYRHRAPPREAPPRRPSPVGPMPGAALVAAIRAALAASPFHGEGHRKAWARLRHAGVRTSKRRVLRLMGTHDLLAPSRAGRLRRCREPGRLDRTFRPPVHPDGSVMQTPSNLLVIMSDEHNPKVAGYAGHPVVATPALDRLAATGTRFAAAYTPSPICVPARAAFATGLPVHRTRAWDNAIAYDGGMPSWHRMLRDRGHHVASIGKLHYRGRPGDDYGLTESILPMHIAGGTGDVTHLVRDPDDVRAIGRKLIEQAGPGESEYTLYDRRVAAAAQVWLRETGAKRHVKPWVLFVSMVAPHFPLTAPPEHYYRYAGRPLPHPKLYGADARPMHPYVAMYRRKSHYDAPMQGEADVYRALAGYFGLVSFLDEQVGKILAALDSAGLSAGTRVVYTSDHGDNLGSRGLWGKATMYEESAGVPLLLGGEGVPAGAVCGTPVTLCDAAATILDAVGAGDAIAEHGLQGASLLRLAGAPTEDRAALSEFHTYGPDAFYMLRTMRHKYVHYVGGPPQLFDLAADPEELADLGASPDAAALRASLEARLRTVVDPEAADRAAKADQAAMIERHGGVAAIRARGPAAFTPAPAEGAQ